MVTLQGIKTCHLAEWTGQESGAQCNGGHCTIYLCITYVYLISIFNILFRNTETIMNNALYYDKDI